MGEDFEPGGGTSHENGGKTGHNRVLILMALVGIVGAVAGWFFDSVGFGLGFLLGTTLAFVNYFWLKRSLRRIFGAAESGQRPRMLAANYFLRYLILGLFVALIFATGAVPIVSLLLGMAAFGFAIVLEGFIRIFSGVRPGKEI